jgi:hydrogenase maturation protein HypF
MHFKYVGLPGGDIASVETGRMAISYLFDMYETSRHDGDGYKCRKLISKWKNSDLIYKMLENKFNCPISSSVGRIFDAVAAITGVCQLNTCEGESAMKLEKLAEDWFCKFVGSYGYTPKTLPTTYKYKIENDTIDISPAISEIINEVKKSTPAEISARFHSTIAHIVKDGCINIRNRHNINKVALSGGVFQNKILTEIAVKLLKEENFEVYTHSIVSPNDGGISLGQAAIAQAIISNR